MKITTKTGDGGETGLFGSKRVKKSSAYMNALGDLDELNSVLGWAGVAWDTEHSFRPKGTLSVHLIVSTSLCSCLQDDIYKIMSFIGSEFKWHPHIEPIGEVDVEFLEGEIAKYEEAIGGLNKFIRPGGNEVAARLHIARSVCRRAERSYVALTENLMGENAHDDDQKSTKEKITVVLKYLNRLSDLLFVMAYSHAA